MPPCKRSAVKRNTILAPGLSSAALAKEEGRKLHPSSSAPQITPWQASKSSLGFGEDVPASFYYAVTSKWATSSTFAQGYGGQARLLEFGEDVKKKLCFLSEVVPDGTVKWSLAATFAIFFAFQKCSYGIAFISFRLSRIFAKKMAAGIFNETRHSETHFELKNFRIWLWNKFLKIASLLQRKTQNGWFLF